MARRQSKIAETEAPVRSPSPLVEKLSGPVAFGLRADGVAVLRLKGFASLCAHAAQTPGISPALAQVLLDASRRFDDEDADERIALLHSIEGLLKESPSHSHLDVSANIETVSAPPAAEHSKAIEDDSTTAKTTSVASSGSAHELRTPTAIAEATSEQTPTVSPAPLWDPVAEGLVDDDGEGRGRSKRAPVPLGDVYRDEIRFLKGVGPSRATLLEERGIRTIGDLLSVLPREYVERTAQGQIGEMQPGKDQVVTGTIVRSGAFFAGRRQRFEIIIDDGTGRVHLVYFRFHRSDFTRRFQPGTSLTVIGDVQKRGSGLQMVHPTVRVGSETAPHEGITPVYPELRGMPPFILEKGIASAVDVLSRSDVVDPLTDTIMASADVMPQKDALLFLHRPPVDTDKETLNALNEHRHAAHRRIAFEELFVLQLAILSRRVGLHQHFAPALVVDGVGPESLPATFARLFQFSPTSAQIRAANEIVVNLSTRTPMARLLQGDVGAGKTAVAALAAYVAVMAGGQVAFMAPTEILAEQHFRTLMKWFHPIGIRVDFLTGTTPKRERRLKVARVRNGEIQILVGTHALLSPDVTFARLSLCVVDEQHRFGVVQRASLLDKGPKGDDDTPLMPHQLVMTATPIPRSLALTLYGDLRVSVLDELPPGRQPVPTKVCTAKTIETKWRLLDETLQKRERAYIVYPLVEQSEKIDLADATQAYGNLCERYGKNVCALLHGRMSSDEKEKTMRAFRDGSASLLVCTTVVEVGVDVPEATLMVVEHAERFGLSQLHQLRGRVGRSHRQSACLLVAGASGVGRDAIRRLRVMERSQDGFFIADEDLSIRGPGDFLGTRQSGLPTLAFGDLSVHRDLLEHARLVAESVLDVDPHLALPKHKQLLALLEFRFKEKLKLATSG